LERAVALCNGERIELEDLPQNIQDFVSSPESVSTELPSGGVDLEALVADFEMNLIRQALQHGKHSQKRAAELLGLTTRSFRYRLQKYGLDVFFCNKSGDCGRMFFVDVGVTLHVPRSSTNKGSKAK